LHRMSKIKPDYLMVISLLTKSHEIEVSEERIGGIRKLKYIE